MGKSIGGILTEIRWEINGSLIGGIIGVITGGIVGFFLLSTVLNTYIPIKVKFFSTFLFSPFIFFIFLSKLPMVNEKPFWFAIIICAFITLFLNLLFLGIATIIYFVTKDFLLIDW